MSTPDPAAVAAAQTLTAALLKAVTDPTVPVETVETAAHDAHNKIEAAGGDYLGTFTAVNRPG